ncbi:Ig-like domain-containing protein [Conexibacter sp. SYSU D00693]|uniref:Ig-like domain-containing protein n=1 Tax=Conexibacter sp. SYSU D00693 TaxID=2812560 RepID=UPI00196B2499|nr:Ig-like domain-containing protein [Conexibacter sp. SYSU D00693]
MLNDVLRGAPRRTALTGVAAIGATLALAAPALAAAPGTPTLKSADDTGTVDGRYTQETSPDFSGARNGAPTVVVQFRACSGADAGSCVGGWTNYDTPGGAPTYDTTATNNTVLPADGTYQFRAVNVPSMETSGSVLVTVDNVGPTTSTPNMVAGSDTGVSSSDNVTADTTPTFDGTTNEVANTFLYVDTFGPDDSEGGYSDATYDVTPGSLSVGQHVARAQSVDRAGNTGPMSGSLNFEIASIGCDQGPAMLGTNGVDFFVPGGPKDEPDFLSTNASQRFEALDGNDRLEGIGGGDCLRGGDDDDQLDGGTGSDRLEGGFGDDELLGGSSSDRLFGGAGDDTIDAGSGDDYVIDAGSGNDVIDSRDGNTETVDCGSGAFDRVTADESDNLIDCEDVKH